MSERKDYCTCCLTPAADAAPTPSLQKIAHIGDHTVYSCDKCGMTLCMDTDYGKDIHEREAFEHVLAGA
ncbi:MAG: hypothetical protein KC477_16830, partial [Oceanospirillaceae bacterium]|nr:hypothetical protein [Oceanospirillaceae bacterium]